MNGEPFVPSLATKAFGTPLLRFKAVLNEYKSEKRKDDNSNREWMIVKFEFTDLVVIESTEPYPFPVAIVDVGYSSTEKTKWDALAQSIKRLFGRTPALDEIVGKMQEWHFTDCKLRTLDDSDKQWKDLPGQAWQVVSIEGLGPIPDAADLTELVLDMLDGKTERDFYQEFYQNSEVRKDQNLVESATNRQLLTTLETAGRAHRDGEGVWHRGGTGAPA